MIERGKTEESFKHESSVRQAIKKRKDGSNRMKATEIREALIHTYIPARIPVFIWGKAGIGKSDLVQQVANEIGYRLIVKILSLCDPTDLLGYSNITKDGKTHLNPPDWLPSEPKAILFLDEFNTGSPMVQNAMLEFIRTGRLGDYRLPEQCTIIAAGNPKFGRVYTTELSDPSKLRFAHIDFDLDADAWLEWAIKAGIMPELCGYIQSAPQALYTFDPDNRSERTGATPRTWERVSDMYKTNPPKSLETQMVASEVDKSAAVGFLGFLRICRDMVSPDRVIAFPLKSPVPDNPNVLYALSVALSRKATAENIDRIVQYMDRCPQEYSMLLMREVEREHKDVLASKGFISWAVKHNLTKV